MRLWEKNIRQVVPYVPGEQPAGDKIIKLNTNENPYPPAPGVKKVLEELDTDRLRKYLAKFGLDWESVTSFGKSRSVSN